MCSMHGLPTIGTIGFAWFDVSGRSLVPSPPAMTTAFIPSSPPGAPSTVARRAPRSRAPKPIQKMTRGQTVPLSVTIVNAERRVEQPGRRLAEQVDLERVAALHGRLVPDEEQQVTQRNRAAPPRAGGPRARAG